MECRLQRHAVQRAFKLRGSLEEQVKVLEPGVCGSLPAGDDLSADSQEHDVMQLQGGQSGGVTVPGGDVLGPQGKAGGAGLRVLGLSGQVMPEEGLQGGHGEGARVRIGMESHDGNVERSQVLEDPEGVVGVDLGSSDEVGQEDLVMAGVGGLLLVVLAQRVNLGQVGVYQGESEG